MENGLRRESFSICSICTLTRRDAISCTGRSVSMLFKSSTTGSVLTLL